MTSAVLNSHEPLHTGWLSSLMERVGAFVSTWSARNSGYADAAHMSAHQLEDIGLEAIDLHADDAANVWAA